MATVLLSVTVSMLSKVLIVFFIPQTVFAIIFLFRTSEVETTQDIEREVLVGMSIKFKRRTCAYVFFREFDMYVFINGLFVEPNHRNRGLGSYLISYCIQNLTKDTYLICKNNLRSFYRRHGFIDVNYSNIPPELLRWRNHRSLNLMVLRQGN